MRKSPIGIDGVSVAWLPDQSGRVTRVRVKVRDKRGDYESRNFDIVSWNDGTPCLPLEARRWAETKRGVFMAGQAVAGKALLADAVAAWAFDAREQGVTLKYIKDVERSMQEAVAAPGMADMQHGDFTESARSWLTSSTSLHKRMDDEGNLVPCERELSAQTRNKKLAQLRAVVHFAVARRWMPYDPLLGLKRFKVPKMAKGVFTLDEIGRTMTPAARSHDYFLRWALLIYGGFRVGEMQHLRWQDIDWQAGTIGVRLQPGVYQLKRDKERTVPMQKELRAILHPLAKPHGFIHPDEHRTADNKQHQRSFTAFLASCGIEVGDRTPHCTRHTWASFLLASGIATTVVKKWAGHASLTTTEGYADASADLEPSVRHWARGEMQFMPKPVSAGAVS